MKNITRIGDILKHSATKFGDRPALGFIDEKALNYNQVYNTVQKVIGLLQTEGIKKGDKVAILSANQPNWGIAYFAITSMGAIVVPILVDFSATEVGNTLAHSEAKAVFVSEAQFNKVDVFKGNDLKTRILLDKFSVIENGISRENLSGLTSSLPEKSEAIEFDIDKNDLASILYTSGTTGKSKGVMLSHWNIVFDMFGSGKIFEIKPHHRLISLLPLAHTYENTIGFLLPIMSGASITYLKKPPTASVLLPALKKVKPHVLLTVPLIIEKVYKNSVLATFNKKTITRVLYKIAPFRKILNRLAGKKLYKTFGGNLEFFGIGGAKLDPEVDRFLHEAKFPHAIGYGLTETAPLLAGNAPYEGRFQTTGKPMVGVTLDIRNVDPSTGIGEIWAKGDNVMQGYYKEPELTADVLTTDGWFKTGDLGLFDRRGNLNIKGRSKNMIIGAAGENIYPEDIEAIINRFRYVVESVVVQKKGKLVAMVHFNMEELENKYVHLKEQAQHFIDSKVEDLRTELQAYVNSQVSKFARVQLVVAHNEPFEKTATKKIKRFLYTD